jgi:ABC-type amino acid transport substrate-binding protein
MGTPIRVCAVLEPGFCSLQHGIATAAEVTTDSQLSGFDVETRAQVLANRPYSVSVFDSYGEVFVRTRAGECDIGWGNYFLTASRLSCEPDEGTCRALHVGTAAGTVDSWEPYRCCVDFSMNYRPNDIVVLQASSVPDFFVGFFTMITSPFVINFFSFAIIWALIFAHLIWLAERKMNSQEFPRSYLDGIDDAMWWTIVTFTTVGYGDKAPITGLGRLTGVVWMVVGITMCGILTGHMANSFESASNIQTVVEPEDLRGKKLCGYASTFRSWYLPDSIGYERIVAANINGCGQEMQADREVLTVMEQPTSMYFLKTDEWASTANIECSQPIATMPIGVVYPKGSSLRDELDAEFLKLFETPMLKSLDDRWFSPVSPKITEEHIQWQLAGPAFGCMVFYFSLKIAQFALVVRSVGIQQALENFNVVSSK